MKLQIGFRNYRKNSTFQGSDDVIFIIIGISFIVFDGIGLLPLFRIYAPLPFTGLTSRPTHLICSTEPSILWFML